MQHFKCWASTFRVFLTVVLLKRIGIFGKYTFLQRVKWETDTTLVSVCHQLAGWKQRETAGLALFGGQQNQPTSTFKAFKANGSHCWLRSTFLISIFCCGWVKPQHTHLSRELQEGFWVWVIPEGGWDCGAASPPSPASPTYCPRLPPDRY